MSFSAPMRSSCLMYAEVRMDSVASGLGSKSPKLHRPHLKKKSPLQSAAALEEESVCLGRDRVGRRILGMCHQPCDCSAGLPQPFFAQVGITFGHLGASTQVAQ